MDDSTRRRLGLPPLPRPASSSKSSHHQRSSRPQWSVGSYGQGILTPGPRPSFGGRHGVGAGGIHRSGPSLSPWSTGSSYQQNPVTAPPPTNNSLGFGVGGGIYSSGPSFSQGLQGSQWSDPIPGSSYQSQTTPPPPVYDVGGGGISSGLSPFSPVQDTGGLWGSRSPLYCYGTPPMPGESFSQGQASQWSEPITGSSSYQMETTPPLTLPVYDVGGGGISSGLSSFSAQEQDCTGSLWGSRSPPYCYGTPMPGESLPDCYGYETPTPEPDPAYAVEVITAGPMSYWSSGAWSVDSDLARVVAPYVDLYPSRPPSPTSPLPPPPLEASVDFAIADPTNPPPSPPQPPATPEATVGSMDAQEDCQGSGVKQEEPALSEGWDWTILFGTSAIGELPAFFLESETKPQEAAGTEAADGLLLGNKQKEAAATEAADGLPLGNKQKEAATEAADEGLLLGNKQKEAATEAADEGLLLGNKQKEAATEAADGLLLGNKQEQAATEAAMGSGSAGAVGGGSNTCMDVDAKATLGVDFADGLFTHEEMKKIMADKALAELVLTDAKRVRRIIRNRRDSAKVKERNKKYVLSLQREAAKLLKENASTLALVRSVKSAAEALITENNELRITLQGFEQLSEAQCVQGEALAARVRHLKALVEKINGKEI